jgi:hypothetical protein
MADYGGLFDFPDYGLSDDQSELSEPPDSIGTPSEATEDEEDAWYNRPSDSEEEDEDDPTPVVITLPLRPIASTSKAFTMPLTTRKEHSPGARIKAIYMLEDKQSAAKIKAATNVSRTRAYNLAAVARERG